MESKIPHAEFLLEMTGAQQSSDLFAILFFKPLVGDIFVLQYGGQLASELRQHIHLPMILWTHWNLFMILMICCWQYHPVHSTLWSHHPPTLSASPSIWTLSSFQAAFLFWSPSALALSSLSLYASSHSYYVYMITMVTLYLEDTAAVRIGPACSLQPPSLLSLEITTQKLY